MGIKDWPADDRPREKLLAKGPSSLSDAELLAIFLRTGVAGKSAIELARDLIRRFGSMAAIAAADAASFSGIKGLGLAKYAQFQAAIEMARRSLVQDMKAGVNLNSPQGVRDYLRLLLGHKPVEVFVAIFLDAQNRAITAEELFSGTLTQTSVYPREIVKRALALNAAAVIFAHNHPSGVAEPSRADEVLTQALKQALGTVDIRVLDHFIVGQGTPMSFAERGLL